METCPSRSCKCMLKQCRVLRKSKYERWFLKLHRKDPGESSWRIRVNTARLRAELRASQTRENKVASSGISPDSQQRFPSQVVAPAVWPREERRQARRARGATSMCGNIRQCTTSSQWASRSKVATSARFMYSIGAQSQQSLLLKKKKQWQVEPCGKKKTALPSEGGPPTCVREDGISAWMDADRGSGDARYVSLWDFEEVQQLALRPMVASAAAYRCSFDPLGPKQPLRCMTSVKGFLDDRWHEGWLELHRFEGQVNFFGPLPFRCSCHQAVHPDAPHQSKNGLVLPPWLWQAVFRPIAQTHRNKQGHPEEWDLLTAVKQGESQMVKQIELQKQCNSDDSIRVGTDQGKEPADAIGKAVSNTTGRGTEAHIIDPASFCTIAVVLHPARTSPDSVELAAPEDTHHEEHRGSQGSESVSPLPQSAVSPLDIAVCPESIEK